MDRHPIDCRTARQHSSTTPTPRADIARAPSSQALNGGGAGCAKAMQSGESVRKRDSSLVSEVDGGARQLADPCSQPWDAEPHAGRSAQLEPPFPQ